MRIALCFLERGIGTIGTGTWNGTTIAMIHGGTGANITGTQGGISYFNSVSTMATSSQLLLNGIVLGGGGGGGAGAAGARGEVRVWVTP